MVLICLEGWGWGWGGLSEKGQNNTHPPENRCFYAQILAGTSNRKHDVADADENDHKFRGISAELLP